MPQTAYTVNPPVAYTGQIANAKNYKARTLVNTTVAAISPGKFVCRGPNAGEMALPAASADVTGGKAMGFVIHQDVKLDTNTARSSVQVNEAGPVMEEGEMFVVCETAFAVGDKPFVRFTVNGLLTPGSIRNDADTARAVEMQFARFVNSGIAGEMAHIRFNVLPA
jgi:hypothetical protein